jgi:biotin carboxyl carrier protein
LTYEIEIGGRIRHVTVQRVGDGFAVAVDHRSWHVDVARGEPRTLSLIVDNPDRPEGVLDIALAPGPARDQLTVNVGAMPVVVTLNGSRRRRGGQAAGSTDGPQRMTTPMPGKVVRVLVQPGDTVAARQAIVVVEAMKMENELRASRGGTVVEVHAREGSSVEAGALLVVIQ